MSASLDGLKDRVKEATEEVRRLEKEIATAEGQLKSIREELKAGFQVETIKDARQTLTDLDVEISDLSKRNNKLRAELEEMLSEHAEP